MSEIQFFVLICITVFGWLSSFFGGLAIIKCVKRVYFALYKKETFGTVVGYKTVATYIREWRGKYYRYYPEIKFSDNVAYMTAIAKDMQDAKAKQYRIGEKVKIAYNRRYPDYMVVAGNHKGIMSDAFSILISGTYIAVLYTVAGIFEKHWLLAGNLCNTAISMILLSFGVQIALSIVLAVSSILFKEKSWFFAIVAPIVFLSGFMFSVHVSQRAGFI